MITLAPSDAPEDAELAAHLDRACRSSKIAVWIDCHLLYTLSATEMGLLQACQHRLRRRHAHLILCSTSVAVEQALRLAFSIEDLYLAPTLDAAVNHQEAGCGLALH